MQLTKMQKYNGNIFAGMGRTSYEDHEKYEQWLNRGQQSLFPDENLNEIEISTKEGHRFKIYKFINAHCKHKKWTVSLNTYKGFSTYNKHKPLNFWFYRLRHDEDRAPLKNK